MTNVQVTGFVPIRQSGSASGVIRSRVPVKSNASRIRKYDALKFTGAGYELATATSTGAAGSSVGASYVNADGARVEMPVLPGSTTYSGTTVFPYDGSFVYTQEDPALVIYNASCDEALTNADLELNFNMILGSTSTTYSDHEIDATSRDTTATRPWRLHGFSDNPLYDPDAADALLEFKLNASASFRSPALNNTGTA